MTEYEYASTLAEFCELLDSPDGLEIIENEMLLPTCREGREGDDRTCKTCNKFYRCWGRLLIDYLHYKRVSK